MTTAATLREAILRCAVNATAYYPNDDEMRARSFIARLSGSMSSLEEREMDEVLSAVIGIRGPLEHAKGSTTP